MRAFLLALVLVFTSASFAQTVSLGTDPAPPAHPCTAAQLKEYYALTHALELAHQVMTKMVDGMQATGAPYFPKSFWDDMRASFGTFDLETAFLPAYQRYISEEDMAQILTFYRTPAGQHILSAQPLITAAAQSAIRESAGKLGEEIYDRHKDEIAAAKAKFDAGSGASKP
jgi:hypothetical protein